MGIVAAKPANKGAQATAETVERRPMTNGNSQGQSTGRTQSRATVTQAAERIRQEYETGLEVRLHDLQESTHRSVPSDPGTAGQHRQVDGGTRPLGVAYYALERQDRPEGRVDVILTPMRRNFSGSAMGFDRGEGHTMRLHDLHRTSTHRSVPSDPGTAIRSRGTG